MIETLKHPPKYFRKFFVHTVLHICSCDKAFVHLNSPVAFPSADQSPPHLESSCFILLMHNYYTHTHTHSLKRKIKEKIFSVQKCLSHQLISLLSQGEFLPQSFRRGVLGSCQDWGQHWMNSTACSSQIKKGRHLTQGVGSSPPPSIPHSFAQCPCYLPRQGMRRDSNPEEQPPQSGALALFKCITKHWNLFLSHILWECNLQNRWKRSCPRWKLPEAGNHAHFPSLDSWGTS